MRHWLITEVEGQRVRVGELEDERFFELTRGIRLPKGYHFVHEGTTSVERVLALPAVSDLDDAAADTLLRVRAGKKPRRIYEWDGIYLYDEHGHGLCRICGKVPAETLVRGRREYLDEVRPYRGYTCEQCADNLMDAEHLPMRRA